MRQWIVSALACFTVAGCGDGGGQETKRTAGSGELTVTVPPISAAEPPPAAASPNAGFETIAAAEPVAEAPSEQPRLTSPAIRDVESEAQPAQVEVALAPAPEAGGPIGALPGETAASSPSEAPLAGAPAWAGYLRKAGFPCQRVASANRIERPAGPGLQYYRVDCEGGGTYQATNKRGHLYFRRWRG